MINSYINTSGNWKNEKLCERTQFRVFPIFTSVDITVYQYGKNVLYFFYNIAQRTLTEEWRGIFYVDIELYQHGSQPISVQNLQILYYNHFLHIALLKHSLILHAQNSRARARRVIMFISYNI